jgi:HEPN domain-containing protein
MASQRDLAEELLALAVDDAVAAEALLDVGVVTDRIVGFHAQQAVEKALKAVLAIRGVEFPFTHSVGALAELSANAGTPLPPELSEVDRLTPFGVGLRYGALDDLFPVARATALAWAEQTIAWARSILDAVE